MRWKNLFCAALFMVAAVGGAYSQKGSRADRDLSPDKRTVNPSPPGNTGEDPGKSGLVIRVYPNPDLSPENFIRVRIPFNNTGVEMQDIEAACPSVSRLSYLLILPGDQTDPAVSRATGNRVFLTMYNPFSSPWRFLNYNATTRNTGPYWTFLDAWGIPMAGASVEIRIGMSVGSGEFPSMPVRQAVLDGKGRLECIPFVGGWPLFVVRHPDYGIAYVSDVGIDGKRGDTVVVPMVPKNSVEAKQAVRGTVIDGEGDPVAGASVSWFPIDPATGRPANGTVPRLSGRTMTDDRGRFSFCEPVPSEEPGSIRPAPSGGSYRLNILPPKHLNLSRPAGNMPVVKAGAPQTFALALMNEEPAFHTFAFKWFDGPIDSADDLGNVTLTLMRNGRQWIQLTYADFKEGFILPPGRLQASITAGTRILNFPAVEVHRASPERLVFQMPPPVCFRGRIVDGVTGEPMAGVYLLSRNPGGDNPETWDAQRWLGLQRVVEFNTGNEGPAPSIKYLVNTVFVTDGEGYYEACLAQLGPGVRQTFMAAAPGYASVIFPKQSFYRMSLNPGPGSEDTLPPPDSNGIVPVPTIEMLPVERVYFPKFVFEDENGNLIDPGMWSSTTLLIRKGKNRDYNIPLAQYLRSREFTPGIYGASAELNNKSYVFEPVDLTTERPETVIFKPRKVRGLYIVYEGQVVDGMTGGPIRGAVVFQGSAGMNPGAPDLSPSQWEDLRNLGPDPDPNTPVLVAIRSRYGIVPLGSGDPQFAITDGEGRFRVAARQGDTPSGRRGLAVVAGGYVDFQQPFYVPSIDPATGSIRGSQLFKPNENGIVTLPAFRMLPAATIRIEPVVNATSGSGAGGTGSLMLVWAIEFEEDGELLDDLRGDPKNLNWSAFGQSQLRGNIEQTVSVPAGVPLNLGAMPLWYGAGLQVFDLGSVKLQSGQEKNFGRVRFDTGLEILVKAVDAGGRPLSGVGIRWKNDTQWSMTGVSDTNGTVRFRVPPDSSGEISYRAVEEQSGKDVETAMPVRIGGAEDAGRTILFEIPESFLKTYRAKRPGS